MSLSWILSFCPNMFSLTLPVLCRDVSADRYGWSNLWGASWLHPDLQLASGCFPWFSRCFVVCCFYLLDLIALELCNSLGRCQRFKHYCVWLLLFLFIPVSSDWAQINLRGLQAVVLCIFRAGVFSGDLEEATFTFGYSARTLDYSYVSGLFFCLVLIIWKKKMLVYKCVKRGNHTASNLGNLQHWFSCKVFRLEIPGTSPGCIPSTWL